MDDVKQAGIEQQPHDYPFNLEEKEEITQNEKGGKQSKIKGNFTEIPPIALQIVSEVMGEGQKRYPREADGSPNWHKIGCMSNLDHAGRHLARFMAMRNQGNSDIILMREELSHFAARALMAVEQWERGEL